MTKRDDGKTSRLVLVASLGFYALVAQTLLFRDFLTVFEGNELGISAFFTSWLLWVAIGALVGRAEASVTSAVLRRFRWFVFLYIPAFLIQRYLVLHARTFVGVEAYELFPFMPMFGMAFLVNAPISFLTGLFFTLACRWTAETTDLPVSRVYIFETLGSCFGGLFVTLELSLRFPPEGIFTAASALLVIFSAGSILGERETAPRGIWRIGVVALVALAFVCLLASGLDGLNWWSKANDRAAWGRLLPEESYEGSFATARGRYFYGERTGQFIVMSGTGVCDILPPDEHAAEVVAMHLAQKPDARRALVFGDNALGVCVKLEELPQTERVTWMNPDPEYSTSLWDLLSSQTGYLGSLMSRDTPKQDIRIWARDTDKRYDLVMLDLPDVTTLALNRYCTEEFFRLLKRTLADNGVISVRVSGGANYLGGELSYLGSSMLHTLESAFKHVVIKPGDETWFIASDGDGLSQAPAVLRDRFASVPGAAKLYPPEGILALYPPDRAEFQLKAYRKTISEADPDLLLNTDSDPKALSYGLFLAIKQAEWRTLAAALPMLFRVGLWVFLLPPALYAALRFVYLCKTRKRGASGSTFDSQFLVFSTGLVSMAFTIVLMFLYQARFGSLVLDIGLVVAVFMLGSFLGSSASNRLVDVGRQNTLWSLMSLSSFEGGGGLILSLLLIVHTLLLVGIACFSGFTARAVWFLLFGTAGFFTGVYFPLAASQMKAAGRSVAQTGSSLETVDHIGGALGGLVTGLLMLPVLGGNRTLWILAAIVAVNQVSIPIPSRAVLTSKRLDRIARPLGYVLAGIALYLLSVSHVVAMQRAAEGGKAIEEAARDMAANADVHEEQARLADGSAYTYFTVADTPDHPGGYVFGTTRWASRIPGYGGPISLAVFADRDGILRDYRILRSNETPAYMALIEARRSRLIGHRIFEPYPFKDIEIVTGATITWDALTRIFETAGRGFAAEVLNIGSLEPAAGPLRFDWCSPQTRDFACLAALALAALALRYWPRVWARRVFLLITFIVTGLLLNLQYSTQHMMSLLSLNFGGLGPNAPFFLVAIVPVIVALFGNVYCGYLCPFGAVQELVGDLNPRRRREQLGKEAWQYGRAAKYCILFLLVAVYALTRDFGVLHADPLITLFGAGRDRFVVAVAIICVTLSLIYPRFWCRNLCPTGAFLSLLNGLSLLRRLTPARYPHRCDLGVRTTDDLDCIHCDRCRLAGESEAPAEPEHAALSLFEKTFLIAVMIVAGVFLEHTASEARVFFRSWAASVTGTGITGAAGKPRDLDVQRVQQLIRQRRLSDYEAQFYGPVPEQPSSQAALPTPNK
jgi:spermidine synthase